MPGAFCGYRSRKGAGAQSARVQCPRCWPQWSHLRNDPTSPEALASRREADPAADAPSPSSPRKWAPETVAMKPPSVLQPSTGLRPQCLWAALGPHPAHHIQCNLCAPCPLPSPPGHLPSSHAHQLCTATIVPTAPFAGPGRPPGPCLQPHPPPSSWLPGQSVPCSQSTSYSPQLPTASPSRKASAACFLSLPPE